MSDGEKSISKAKLKEIRRLTEELKENRAREGERFPKRETEQETISNIPSRIPREETIPTGEDIRPRPRNRTERMWVVSDWENRKKIDPTFDIDNWFQSSIHLDNKQRRRDIEDFWIGKGSQDTKQKKREVEDFWTGKGDKDTTNFWTSSMWGI